MTLALEGPIYGGQAGWLATDPWIDAGGGLTYTDGDPATSRPALARATRRSDGAWGFDGLVLRGRPRRWDEGVETGCLVRVGTRWHLYYCGYKWGAVPKYAIGVARSASPAGPFTRYGSTPLLVGSPTGYDPGGCVSPTVVQVSPAVWAMVYSGWREDGVRVLGARSTDGLAWTKAGLVLDKGAAPWAPGGDVWEPSIAYGAGQWWMAFTATVNTWPYPKPAWASTDGWATIGLASSASPFGPWAVRPEPLVVPVQGTWTEGGVVAPSLVFVGDTLTLWAHALGWHAGEGHEGITIGSVVVPPSAAGR